MASGGVSSLQIGGVFTLPSGAMHNLLADIQRLSVSRDFTQVSQWMRTPSTQETTRHVLVDMNVPIEDGISNATDAAASPKIVLAILCMAMTEEEVFSETPNDAIMKRESRLFFSRFQTLLGTPDSSYNAQEVCRRAQRFYRAWARIDRRVTLEQLMSAVVAAKARGGADAMVPEDLLSSIRMIGGDDAEAEARRRFSIDWTAARNEEELHRRITETCECAMWDAVVDHIERGNYDSLFDAINQVHVTMKAMVAHSPTMREHIDRAVDIDLLRQQVTYDALEVNDVEQVIHYVVDTLCGWHAASDAATGAKWRADVERLLVDTPRDNVKTFVVVCLVPVLRGAIEHLRILHRRIMDLVGDANVSSAMDEQD